LDNVDRLNVYLVTIIAIGALGIAFAPLFTSPLRFVLALLLGSLGIASIYDLSRRIESGPERYPTTSSIKQAAGQSEADRITELLSRLRSLREKIGEATYKRLEEEYLQKLKDSLEKEVRLTGSQPSSQQGSWDRQR